MFLNGFVGRVFWLDASRGNFKQHPDISWKSSKTHIWGFINIPGSKMTMGNFSHLVGNIIFLVVSLMVIPCKGPFNQPIYIYITKVHFWDGVSAYLSHMTDQSVLIKRAPKSLLLEDLREDSTFSIVYIKAYRMLCYHRTSSQVTHWRRGVLSQNQGFFQVLVLEVWRLYTTYIYGVYTA